MTLPNSIPVPGTDSVAFLAEYHRLMKALRGQHDDCTKHLALARLLMDNRQEGRAHSLLQAARALQPRRLESQYMLGELHTRQGRHEESCRTYREILRIKPIEPRAMMLLGSALMALGRAEEAHEPLSRSVELDPKLKEAYWRLAEIATMRGDHRLALTHYQSLMTLEPKSADLFHRIGVLQWERGLKDRAVSGLQQAMSLDPEHLPSRMDLARLYLEEDLPTRAIELLQSLVNGPMRSADVYIMLARCHEKAGDAGLALATLLQMSRQFPDDTRSHRELARVYRLKGERELAEEEYLRAITIDPTDTSLVFELGEHHLEAGRPGKAIELYRLAAERFSGDPRIHAELARVYERHDRPAECIEACSKALEIQPDSEDLYLQRAKMLIKMGRYDVALEDFEHVRRLNPRHPEARMDLELIRGHQKYQEALELHRKGAEALAAGLDAQALTHYEEVIRRVPDKVDWLKEYLDLALKTGKFDEALSTFEQLETLEPRDFAILKRHADLCHRLHNYDLARELYERALKLDSDSAEVRIGLIRCMRHKRINQSKAPDSFDVIEQRYKGSLLDVEDQNLRLLELAYLHVSLGYLLKHGNEWADRAMEYLKSIRPPESDEVSRYRWLGLYEAHRKLEDDESAIPILERLHRRYPECLAEALGLLDHYMSVAEYRKAYKFAGELAEKHPSNGLIRARRLQAYARWAEGTPTPVSWIKKKVAELRDAVARDPRDAMSFFDLGMGLFYLMRPTEWPETRPKINIALNRAMSLAPDSMWPIWGLIKTSLEQEDGGKINATEVSRQVAQIRNALARFPREACFHYYMGKVLLRSQDPRNRAQAVRHLVTATLFEPSFIPAEYALGVHYQESHEETKAYHHFLRVLESVQGSRYQGLVQRRLRRLVP